MRFCLSHYLGLGNTGQAPPGHRRTPYSVHVQCSHASTKDFSQSWSVVPTVLEPGTRSESTSVHLFITIRSIAAQPRNIPSAPKSHHFHTNTRQRQIQHSTAQHSTARRTHCLDRVRLTKPRLSPQPAFRVKPQSNGLKRGPPVAVSRDIICSRAIEKLYLRSRFLEDPFSGRSPFSTVQDGEGTG